MHHKHHPISFPIYCDKVVALEVFDNQENGNLHENANFYPV